MNRPQIERYSVVAGAPAPSGRYVHALRAGGFIFCAGQGSKDPATGREVGLKLDDVGQVVGHDVAAQLRGCFRNLTSVLAAAGASLSDVVEVNVFLKDMSDFDRMNEVFAEHFPEDPPVRTTVGVADLPGHNFIEIRATAVAQPTEGTH